MIELPQLLGVLELELPRVDHPMARMERVELAPFARAAAAGLPMIMTAHVVFPAIEPGVPATLSHAAITGLLRGTLGYRGWITLEHAQDAGERTAELAYEFTRALVGAHKKEAGEHVVS